MAGPHDWDWESTTTTTPVVQNQVSPGHPSGAYNQNLNPPTTVDYTTPPVVDTSGGGDMGSGFTGTLPIIQDLGSSNLEKNLSDEERKLNFLFDMQNKWETGELGSISSPFGLTGQEFDPHTSEWYGTESSNPYGLMYHGATEYDSNTGEVIGGTQMGDPGAILLNAKAVEFGHPPIYGKPVLSGLGQELFDRDWTDGGKNPYGTIPNPEEIYYGSPIMENIEDIAQSYYNMPEGDGWDDRRDWNYDDRRDAKLDLIAALQGGAPIKNLEQSGFMESMEDPYAEAQQEALNKGIFSGVAIPGVSSKGLQRLIRSYGSGLQSPLYANVAKGGIVGLLGV